MPYQTLSLPVDTRDDLMDRGLIDTIALTKSFQTDATQTVRFPNSCYLRPGKLGFRMTFSSGRSTLFTLVLHVVSVGAKKEVFGVAARRVIARMTHQQGARVCPCFYKVGDTVRNKTACLLGERAVARLVKRCLPFQAASRTCDGGDFGEKSFDVSGRKGWNGSWTAHATPYINVGEC